MYNDITQGAFYVIDHMHTNFLLFNDANSFISLWKNNR